MGVRGLASKATRAPLVGWSPPHTGAEMSDDYFPFQSLQGARLLPIPPPMKRHGAVCSDKRLVSLWLNQHSPASFQNIKSENTVIIKRKISSFKSKLLAVPIVAQQVKNPT